ncbi:long-chain fatty acid--CoA ligase [Candidatus Methylomirabilis lanthanidiphila]|uniref:Long-chain fatty acid--CoA ligase n=1 Tax=Candidatus Methylomirabilis lanthanidiphila TaxID=2211376 RepID=A0A564ZMV5_9BACT|nr:long-chain fatty acid--CoA ligase [Candidatus Methylomirabilis lanthanidiphila]VUZ86426.1 long-chain fatty acid--CoA ligase [Candidatus Methylomirabilis lanthanidiphila]
MAGTVAAMNQGLDRPWFAYYDPWIPRHLEYPDIPLHRFLTTSARNHPDRTAIIFYGRRLTYRALDDAATRFAAALADRGLAKGDRVSLFLPNCPQMVIAYYGTLRAGGLAVSTSPLYSTRELEHQLNDSGAETIVVLSKLYPLVKEVAPRTGLKRIIVANIKEYFPPMLRLLFTLLKEKREGHRPPIERRPGTEWFSEMLASAPATPPATTVGADDPALLQYTGGTTGVAKGAMLTHRNLVANTMQIAAWMMKPAARSVEGESGDAEVFLGAIPFFHIYGMTVVMNLCISLGHTMVLLPQFKTQEVLDTIAKYRPTLFPGVPTMYVAINNHPDVGRYDLHSIKACLSGAAPLPIEVANRFEALTGARLVEGYGLTEASPVTHANPLFGARKVGTIGLPLPDTDARIVDLETGERTLPSKEIGEVAVKGPQIMAGYWHQPGETAMVLRDGWLYTGDIGYMDEQGYFTIVDRKKEMIIAGGFNVYPREVEEPLYEHPGVKEVVAVGLPDPYRGETVKVYVVLKEGERVTEQEIIDFCKPRMAKHKVPTLVEFRQELPKTLVGKVLRRALREEEMAKRKSQDV